MSLPQPECDELGGALPLKRSASTNETNPNLQNLSLREAKSYAGPQIEPKCVLRAHLDPEANHFELFYASCEEAEHVRANATTDKLTREVFFIREQMLELQKRACTLYEIAAEWRKDCRMWLWKNTDEYKKNRSVAETNSNQ